MLLHATAGRPNLRCSSRALGQGDVLQTPAQDRRQTGFFYMASLRKGVTDFLLDEN